MENNTYLKKPARNVKAEYIGHLKYTYTIWSAIIRINTWG